MVDQITEIPLPGRSLASACATVERDAPSATMPSFVAGPENRLVATAVDRLLRGAAAAEDSVERRHAPAVLWLHGPSGTGKTHLARGIVEYWQSRRGLESAEYMTANDFRRRFAEALEADTVAEFRHAVRGRQLLAIDDLHRLPRGLPIYDELRYTLDEFEESCGMLLVTSAQPIGLLRNLPADLQSRLAAGLTLQLAPPGKAARRRLVTQLVAALGQEPSKESLRQLADAPVGSARELFGAVFELSAARNGKRRPGRPAAAQPRAQPTLREIVAVVARYYDVPQKVLKSSSRRQSAVYARAMIVYLARELSDASYQRIGDVLGGRDHTTIMHSYRKIQTALPHDLATQQALNELRRILLSQ